LSWQLLFPLQNLGFKDLSPQECILGNSLKGASFGQIASIRVKYVRVEDDEGCACVREEKKVCKTTTSR
jgi:hypothetical protein